MQKIQNISKRYGGLAIKLKNNQREKRKDEYSKLKRKIVLQVLLIIISAAAIVFLMRFVIQENFSVGDVIVQFFTDTLQWPEFEAFSVYHILFPYIFEIITILSILGLLAILLNFSVSLFVKYFDEVSDGMDRLAEDSDDKIILSPELDFMENKINQIKNKLRKQKKAVLDAEQRKNDLVVYLAHDIKTPLTSVIGYLSLLDEAADMPPEQKDKYVDVTLEKAYRLEQLIDEFFEITRFNLQTIVLNKENINLLFMLQQLVDEFYPMLTPQGKQVSINVPDGLTLWGDADKLARVFNNILKNAIAYSYENCVIDISAGQQDINTILTFTNQGNPIPPAKLETIFEKFFRLDTSRSTYTGGSGLGLAIAKEIVNAHGGEIFAQSDSEKTVFTVTLPQKQETRR